MDDVDVVVVGGGQAGLAVAHQLTEHALEPVVLERARVGQSWRDRWDSFTLVTPNWTLDLPGMPYAGDDPEGHVPRDEIVAYLEAYAERAGVEVREGFVVNRLAPEGDSWSLKTSEGDLRARAVVVCTGTFRVPHQPVELGPTGVMVIDADTYRRPEDLSDGRVLVVGSGQSGCQISEELHLAGRDVVLSCGRAPWVPRRIGDHDVVTWLRRTPFFDATLADLPSPAARLGANVQATGAQGGHDLHYRVLQDLGVTLVGHLHGLRDGRAHFEDDLRASVVFGDARAAELRALLRTVPGIPLDDPGLADPPPFEAPSVTTMSLDGFGAVVLTSGFRPGYRSWVDADVFDAQGFPVTDDECSAAPGLWFCGVHFLRRRSSALLFGVGRDAAVVAASVAAYV